MAIRFDPKATDGQGLPVVSWEEDRNLFAPGGVSPARVCCFIRPGEDGVLQFASVGPVRHGAFEEARPWEQLVSFAVERADQHYYSAANRALLDVVTSKSKSGAGKLLTTDGAFVVLANFADEHRSVSMHLNCADCKPVEAAMLHDRLRLEFLDRRAQLINDQCDGEYVWPEDRPFVAYDPADAAAPPSRWINWLANLVVTVVLGLMAWVAYWLLLR
jgi:hypothetical protein